MTHPSRWRAGTLARKASNDFEHGIADLGGVRQAADDVTRELFDLVRSSILSVVPSLDEAICDQIMSKGPVDVSPFYKQVTGYIVSDEPSDPLNLGSRASCSLPCDGSPAWRPAGSSRRRSSPLPRKRSRSSSHLASDSSSETWRSMAG